jgi:hypothetical protein
MATNMSSATAGFRCKSVSKGSTKAEKAFRWKRDKVGHLKRNGHQKRKE